MDLIPSILPFHPSVYRFRQIILKHYIAQMADQTTKDIFKILPATSYKREYNSCNHSFPASHPQPPISSDAGTHSHNRRHCNTSKFLTNCSATHIDGPKASFNVTEKWTIFQETLCMICEQCRIIYTGVLIVDRITEHILSI